LWITACTSTQTGSDAATGDKTPAALSGELTVLTYNVWGLPSDITKNDTQARIKQISPMLKDFDIIGVQELFLREGYKEFKQSDEYKTQKWFDKLRDDRAMPSGLMALARFSSKHYKTQHFSFCNGVFDGASDCLASKGFQMVRLEIAPGVEIDFYNSHFEAGKGEKDQDARRKNLLELRQAMQTWSKGRAMIFVGDTNMKNERPMDKAGLAEWLKTEELTDACDAVQCKEPGRIDRIFFRGSTTLTLTAKKWWVPAQFKDKDKKALSNHDPIAAILVWKRK
jgi:endonuclease/exonuclease/phosphatase family metal-dependent hydrolase